MCHLTERISEVSPVIFYMVRGSVDTVIADLLRISAENPDTHTIVSGMVSVHEASVTDHSTPWGRRYDDGEWRDW